MTYLFIRCYKIVDKRNEEILSWLPQLTSKSGSSYHANASTLASANSDIPSYCLLCWYDQPAAATTATATSGCYHCYSGNNRKDFLFHLFEI